MLSKTCSGKFFSLHPIQITPEALRASALEALAFPGDMVMAVRFGSLARSNRGIWAAFTFSDFFWFSRELNPLPPTGQSSNPLEIYRRIDNAVKTGDFAEPEIKDLSANIRLAIRLRVAPNNPQLAKALRRAVQRASLTMFRPQLWRLGLSNIDTSRVSPGNPNWDEQRIADLRPGEFEVVVE